MKLDRPRGKVPQLTRLGGLAARRRRGLSLSALCLLAAVIGGLAGWPGGIRQETSPNTQVHRTRLAAFTAGSIPQTITFTQPADAKVGVPVTLSATAAPDPSLTVSFTSNTPAVCTVSGSGVTTVTAGVCVITASQSGDATYAAAPEVARSFQVTAGQAAQIITFAPPADATVGVPVSLSASAAPDSSLMVSFSSDTPQVCTVSGSTAQTVTGGTCTITASQGGSADYAAAPQVTQSFQVTTGQEPQTVSFTPPPDVVKAGVPVGEPVALSATATSGLLVSFTSDTPQVCTMSGSTAQTVARGTCTITASQGGSEIYAPAAPAMPGSFNVYTGGEPQAIAFKQPPDTQVGVPVTLLASATSGLPVSFASNTTRVCTVAGSTVLTVATGMCMITASQSGSKIYAPAQAQRRFMVKLGQTISFAQPPDTQAGAQVTLSAIATSQLPVSFMSSTLQVCTVAGSTVTTVATGTCTITATQGGDENYAVAPQVQRSFTVKLGQTITFAQPKDTEAGEQVTLSASATSELPVSFTSSTPAVCTVSGSTATTVSAGTCTITASQGGNADYAAAPDVQRSLTVKAGQTITFAQPKGTKAGEPVTLSASATSELPVSFTSSTPAVCTVSGSTATTVSAGTCTITASQGGNADYAAAPDVRRSFQVNPVGKKAQTIAFAQPSPVAVGEPVTLSASSTSGLAVSFTSSTPAVCSVAGSTATPVAAGTCTITASQSGDASYAPARDVQRSAQVRASPVAQVITFTPPPDTKVGEPVTLSASSSSGLPVSFASNTPAVCAVSGPTVTTTAAGACMITASQGGNARYAPARDVTRSFQVNLTARPVNPAGHKSQAITFDPPSQAKAGDPVTLSASASSGLPVAYTSDTPPVCTVSGSTVITVATGACTVTASQDGSADYAAAPPETRSFQVNPVSPKGTGPLVFLLAAAAIAAAGLAAGVRRLRLRSRRPLVHAANVRAVPEPGPPGQVDVHDTGPTATRTVRIESSPGASITTIEEARP